MDGGWVVVKACSADQREDRSIKPSRADPATGILKDVGILVFRKVTLHEVTGKCVRRDYVT